jgi:CHAT domain-containing protein
LRYLGAEYTLFYLPSASVLPFVRDKAELSAEPAGDSLLAMVQARAEGLPALRYAEEETRAIAALYGVQPLVNKQATETALASLAGQSRLVHIAAHGQLNLRRPLFSRLVLAPDDASDGSLEVHEVYGLGLSQTDLVVLSACQTQLGAHSAGDDIVGLNRAFLYAGTPTVVASLWSVDDQSTGELMLAFYSNLKQGLGKAEALRAAQAEVRLKRPNPYYWAAFVLTGDPGKITQRRAEAGSLDLIVSGAALVLACAAALFGYWWWRKT